MCFENFKKINNYFTRLQDDKLILDIFLRTTLHVLHFISQIETF